MRFSRNDPHCRKQHDQISVSFFPQVTSYTMLRRVEILEAIRKHEVPARTMMDDALSYYLMTLKTLQV